jgi:hypothetical protein
LALDELHARRLETVMTLVENALERIELLLAGVEAAGGWGGDSPAHGSAIAPGQIREARRRSEEIRKRLRSAARRFSIRPHKPEPRQTLAAELSSLWVILENARPRRMKGYGREFAPADRADWESLVHDLLAEVEHIRSAVSPTTE